MYVPRLQRHQWSLPLNLCPGGETPEDQEDEFAFYIIFPNMIYAVQKFEVGKMFLMFLKEVSYAHQDCIYLIKNTVKIVKIYWNLKWLLFYIFYNLIYSCEFSAAITLVLIVMSVLKTAVLLNIFVKTMILFFQELLMNSISSKEHHLFEKKKL